MFEEQIAKGLFSVPSEKTFIDKVMAKEEVAQIRDLIKKPRLNREDLLELLYLLSSVESKLLNYGAWDRYVILKYFVWIREYVKINEILYDYADDLYLKEKLCSCGAYHFGDAKVREEHKHLKQCKCDAPKFIFVLSARSKQMFENNMRLQEHNVKFLIDLYFNIGRTTLSLGATGIMEILKNKFEISYPSAAGTSVNYSQQQQPQVILKR